MLGSLTSNPKSGGYPSSGDSDLFSSLAKKTAIHIVKENQEFVDGFANKFFRRAIEEGGVIGADDQPVQLSQEKIEEWLPEYKEGLLNQLLTDEVKRLKESSEKKLAQVKKDRQDILTQQFWSIFNGKTPLSQERYSEVFATYLADYSLTVEETNDGESFGRINSMNPVIRYLQENPLIKTCDFRTFKAEVNDIETLADFLKTPDAYAIKGVAFKSVISQIAKERLAEAISARASTSFPLKVQYFA